MLHPILRHLCWDSSCASSVSAGHRFVACEVSAHSAGPSLLKASGAHRPWWLNSDHKSWFPLLWQRYAWLYDVVLEAGLRQEFQIVSAQIWSQETLQMLWSTWCVCLAQWTWLFPAFSIETSPHEARVEHGQGQADMTEVTHAFVDALVAGATQSSFGIAFQPGWNHQQNLFCNEHLKRELHQKGFA